jgi:hypothetical protein
MGWNDRVAERERTHESDGMPSKHQVEETI